MAMWEGLLGEKKKLDELYHKELSTVLDLQRVLLGHIIPDMFSDLGMNEFGRHIIEDWAKDTRECVEWWMNGG